MGPIEVGISRLNGTLLESSRKIRTASLLLVENVITSVKRKLKSFYLGSSEKSGSTTLHERSEYPRHIPGWTKSFTCPTSQNGLRYSIHLQRTYNTIEQPTFSTCRSWRRLGKLAWTCGSWSSMWLGYSRSWCRLASVPETLLCCPRTCRRCQGRTSTKCAPRTRVPSRRRTLPLPRTASL